MPKGTNGRISVGILDHTYGSLGGAQLVAGQLASTLSRFYHVDLIRDWKEYDLGRLGSAFSLDLSKVTQRGLEPADGFEIPGRHGFYQQLKRSRILTERYDLFIYCGHGVPPFCHAKNGLVYCHFPDYAAPKTALKTMPRWSRRNRLDRLIRGGIYQKLWQMRMKGYVGILANSLFTARWVERRWGRPAEVLYPPVGLSVPPIEKENIIASVGRFCASRTGGKQQLAQISVLRKLRAEVSEPWRMYLIGSCYSPSDQSYLTAVKQAAEGLPTTFLVNAPRGAVCRALAESKIFWHAQGLSNDETETPYEAEHFGIATVEAMRAGCVPVVIDSGGQREIVQDGFGGFLCKDLDEILRSTITLARDGRLLQVLSQRARERSMDFTNEVFDRQILRIVSECLHSKLWKSRPSNGRPPTDKDLNTPNDLSQASSFEQAAKLTNSLDTIDSPAREAKEQECRKHP